MRLKTVDTGAGIGNDSCNAQLESLLRSGQQMPRGRIENIANNNECLRSLREMPSDRVSPSRVS